MPYVVKPANEGSSVGISIVKTKKEAPAALKEALKYDSKIIIEEFVKGQEITVAVINGKALPVIEVRPKSGFYNFEAKYYKRKDRIYCSRGDQQAQWRKRPQISR